MKSRLAAFYAFLDQPIAPWSRIALALLVIPLLLAFTAPLWRISMTAPQYPKGLYLEIYAHKLDAGHRGHDVDEINELNHYIGMRKLDRAALSDLDWIPFALIALALLALRCAAIGNVRMLIDLLVTAGFIAAFSMARFVYKLYVFGHDLDPHAAITLKPFTPAIFGEKQIANFSTRSYPQLGTAYVSVFLVGLTAITALHLWRGRRAAALATP